MFTKKCVFQMLILFAVSVSSVVKCFQGNEMSNIFHPKNEHFLDDVDKIEKKIAEDSTMETNFSDNFPLKIDCQVKVCVRKCCKYGFAFDIPSGCVDVSSNYTSLIEWLPVFSTSVDTSKLVVLYGNPPNPKGNNGCFIHNEGDFHLRQDGSLFYKEKEETFSHEFYCIDKKIEGNGATSVMGVICYQPALKSEYDKSFDNITMIGLCISCLFLSLILLMHLLSNQRKDLPSKSMISSCINLLFSFLLLIVSMSGVVTNMKETLCVTLGIGLQFFFLSFYFWLNVMCYETSRIIRGTVNTIPLNKLQGSNRRYLRYSIYSWGIPFVISMVTCIMQYLPEDLPSSVEPYIIRPNIGHGRCWFEEKSGSVFVYFYCIEICIHISNACLMSHSAYLLSKEKMGCLYKRRRSPIPIQNHNGSDNLKMFWRHFSIFILYVFIWSLNCVTLIYSKTKFWRIVDFAVSLQGAYLFFIVMKTKKHLLIGQNYERFFDIAKEFSTKVSLNSRWSNKTPEEASTASQNEELSL